MNGPVSSRAPVQPALVPRARLLTVLDEYERAGLASAHCFPPPAEPGPGWDWLPDSARTSGTGLALLVPREGPRVALAPPFPFDAEAPGVGPFKALLAKKRRVGIVLLRLGKYAVCVGDDEAVVSPKSGSRYVKGRHRAGGQSQHRFEHNREKWVRELYDEVCAVCLGRFTTSSGVPTVDWMALGGDRTVLAGFLKRCESLGGLRDRVLPWRPPVGEPGVDALHPAVRAVWSTRVYRAPE
jgi:hypothetical protein